MRCKTRPCDTSRLLHLDVACTHARLCVRKLSHDAATASSAVPQSPPSPGGTDGAPRAARIRRQLLHSAGRPQLFSALSLTNINAPEYHFVSHWLVKGEINEVVAVICDGAGLASWWPSGFVSASRLSVGDDDGLGAQFLLRSRGRFPYVLQWTLTVSEITLDSFTITATGDSNGRGVWKFEPRGPVVAITFDWKVQVNKKIVRYLTPVLRPAFSANHRWVMARGQESLVLELERRRAPLHERDLLAMAPLPPFPRLGRGRNTTARTSTVQSDQVEAAHQRAVSSALARFADATQHQTHEAANNVNVQSPLPAGARYGTSDVDPSSWQDRTATSCSG
jgi:hypothetical protein